MISPSGYIVLYYNYNLHFLLLAWPLEAAFVKKALDSNQEYSHVEGIAQKQESPAKHSLSQVPRSPLQQAPSIPALPRILQCGD